MGKPEFDPSQPFKSSKPEFDPSQPFKSSKKKSWLDTDLMVGTPRGLIQGSLNTLPTVGMIGGSALGGTAGAASPVPGGALMGGLAGAGLGQAGGESLKQLGEKYILGKEKTRDDFYQKPIKAIPEGMMNEVGGQVIGATGGLIAKSRPAQWIGGKIGRGAAKVGELFTGVPAKEIETYANHADDISAMAKASDNNVARAADDARGRFEDAIAMTKNDLNQQIGNALEGNLNKVDGKQIVASLQNAKTRIDPDLYPEQLGQIDEMINKIKTKMDESGEGSIFVSDANALKKFLQGKAESAYRAPGEIFSVGTEAANAAKSGAAKARGLVNGAAPDVAAANAKLAEIHDIDELINPNILAPGKPEAGLLAAGSGGNSRNAENLRRLGKLTDTDMLGEAEKLAAMRTFGSPKLMAADSTGKAVGRMGLGAGTGFLIGGAPGALVGGAITSPAALKVLIDSGKFTSRQVKTMMGSQSGRLMLMRAIESMGPLRDE